MKKILQKLFTLVLILSVLAVKLPQPPLPHSPEFYTNSSGSGVNDVGCDEVDEPISPKSLKN